MHDQEERKTIEALRVKHGDCTLKKMWLKVKDQKAWKNKSPGGIYKEYHSTVFPNRGENRGAVNRAAVTAPARRGQPNRAATPMKKTFFQILKCSEKNSSKSCFFFEKVIQLQKCLKSFQIIFWNFTFGASKKTFFGSA